MKLVLTVLCFIILSSLTIFSQSGTNIITLKNGDIYKGQIIKDVPGEYVVIQLMDKSEKEIKYDDIAKRETEDKNLQTVNQKFHGIIGFSINLGYLNALPVSSQAEMFENNFGLVTKTSLTLGLELEYFLNQSNSVFLEVATNKYSGDSKEDISNYFPPGDEMNKGWFYQRFIPTISLNYRNWFDTRSGSFMPFITFGAGIFNGEISYNLVDYLPDDQLGGIVLQIGGGFRSFLIGPFGLGLEAKYRYFVHTTEKSLTAINNNLKIPASDFNMGILSLQLNMFFN